MINQATSKIRANLGDAYQLLRMDLDQKTNEFRRCENRIPVDLDVYDDWDKILDDLHKTEIAKEHAQVALSTMQRALDIVHDCEKFAL